MADEKKLKQINKNGILIHQLRPKDKNAALSYFSRKSIEKVSYNSDGLYIFFKEYDLVIRSILRQKIEVGGLFYKIYPMVTNLTICGIGPYAANSTIENVMRSYGFIIDSYRVEESMEHNRCKTVSLTNDHRIILDVPEVYAPDLTPIRLPNTTNKTFEVLFFCRLCRRNGHMQFQCSKATKSSSSYSISQQNTDVCRQISWENASSNVVINYNRTNCSESDFCADTQKSKIYPNSPLKTEKEQRDFSDRNCFSKNSSHNKNDTSKSCSAKPTRSKSKNCHNVHKIDDSIDIRRKRRQDNFSSMLVNSRGKLANSSASSKKQSTEFLERRSSEKRNFHCHQRSDNEGRDGKFRASTSNKYNDKETTVVKSKRRKDKFTKVLSSLLPPNTDLFKTKKLIKVALCNPKDIPADVKSVLVTIQKYNQEQKKKQIDGTARRFLYWINKKLDEMKVEKLCMEKSHKDSTKEQECVKDKKSATEISKKQSPTKRKVSLSLGIREAISKTAGELQPELLCNFLNQVRGRKKLFEVAYVFTQNISGLASQLLEIQNAYYRHVQKRGPDEDRDISYIKRLRLRLLQHNERAAEICLKGEPGMTERHLKTESDLTEGHMKKESDRAETPMKLEPNMPEESMESKTGMTEMPIKSEVEIFMRQSSNVKTFNDKTLSYNLYEANYFTNITQMPSFSLDYIKTEVDDID